jgi:hypothetical protein
MFFKNLSIHFKTGCTLKLVINDNCTFWNNMSFVMFKTYTGYAFFI